MLPVPARQDAFTLFDLIVALAVAGLLAGIGIPAFDNTVLNARQRAAVNAFVVSSHLARSHAVRRNLPVVICPGAGNSPCARPADWNAGWVVFVNSDADVPPELDSGEPVLFRFEPPARIEVQANRDAFRFHRVGLRSTNGTLRFCDRRGPAHARAVIVSYTGRPRVSRHMPDGRPVYC